MPAQPAPTGEALRVTGASRRIEGRLLLDGVDVVVEKGVIVGLAGPNGAGKTSLMRAVGGRLRLDAGTILIADQPAASARRNGQLGVVPQDIALYPHLTVRENLAVFARLSGTPSGEVRARVDRGLEWAGLVDRGASLAQVLSGGMRRRANLVAGMLHDPALLLLDEPTVGVDGESRARLHALLGSLRKDGMGMLVATHDLDEAAALCDRVIVLNAGRVVASGTVPELVAQAFEGGRELVVTVTGTPPEEGLMAAEGFAHLNGDAWVRGAEGPIAELPLVEARLRSAGVSLADVRLRYPTLAGAVARLSARASAGDA